ncbi:type I-E CRISPR-associated protein Cse2/CasB [Streptomyces sp. BE20]|uniref:type I-E CRISPR-associated protein Cse2/CasB n=1 Tax=Streptomyces sp. BE20 TaxID=3002525 RepID=UPI002E77B388|nr:type I-E CRISPR-associated protein Cse2/CasB [Streptomyces sp. BE20]MEE1821654.1 type I-E CRISPR-associated protein Cse2/CasB [Streptomyces sp. BE20]
MSDTPTIPAPTLPPSRQSPKPATGATVPALGRARAFTTWIDRRSHDDPGVRAALRRGIGKAVNDAPSMHQFVASWLTEEQLNDRDVQRAHYAVAALIAAQRRTQYAAATTNSGAHTAEGPSTPDTDDSVQPVPAPAAGASRYGKSLGTSFAAGVRRTGADGGLREASAETRLSLLTRQSVDGLHRHLPGALRQLRDRDVEVDWAQLLVDLCRWRRHSGEIKRRWLQDYYRALQADGERRAREADLSDGENAVPAAAIPQS